LPHRLFSSHTAAGNLQEVIAAHRQVLPIVDPLSAKPPKADIVARPPNILLCQNARALTSPREMVKIDADWVVLSACNTAAGAGAGAEAASGLGSAFFYAGTRALLVTNWSVHSVSARELISDVFRRQSADSSISRSEALRQAMMALLDGPGAVN